MTDDLATNIRVAVAYRGVNGAVLARAIGVSRMAVSKWMRGKCAPRSSELVQLARVLDCNLEFLMTPLRLDMHPVHEKSDEDDVSPEWRPK